MLKFICIKVIVFVSAFQFASYYQDHMVLQRNPHSAVIWGYGTVSSRVFLVFDNALYSTVVTAGNYMYILTQMHYFIYYNSP